MLILTKEDIQTVFTMKDAIEASKQALKMYSEHGCEVPLRVNINIPKQQGQSLFMPAYVDALDTTGIKIVSVFPNNIERGLPSVPAQMILLDGTTGQVCAIMEGTYLTQLRTGAVQGAATDILARQDARIAVLFGTGGQAESQLEAMLTVRKLEEVRVYDLQYDRAEVFAKRMQDRFSSFGTKIVPVQDGNEAVIEADLITCVTTSTRPVFDATLVKKGTHINGVGSYTPQMQEIPAAAILNADKVIFDTTAGVLAEAGDVIIPIEQGLVTADQFTGELGEVILGQVKGRESDDEVTVFKTVGTAVLDVVTAHFIYKKALECQVGQHINL